MTALLITLHLVVAASATSADSHYQSPRWSAFYGCWQAESAPDNELVCVSPVTGGVRLATVVDGRVRDESRIMADGIARTVRQAGCNGTERARWSNDGQRVFLDSDFTCANAARRSVRGMFAFITPDEWVSVQTASQGDSVATRVVRFRAVDGVPSGLTALAANRTVSDQLLEVDEADVAEAVDNIGAPAAQEWMRVAGEPYQLQYQPQGVATSSALEQMGRMSNPVEVREVVRVVERPVYVHNTYVVDRYWHYSPWGYGYHYHDWYWMHRPVIVIRWPLVIHRNTHYHRYWYRDRYDYWRRDRDWRDDRYGRDDRYRRDDRDGRDGDRTRGRVTRDGYSSGRERAVPVIPSATTYPARQESPRSSSGTVVRQAAPRESREPRASGSIPARSSTTSRASTSRDTPSRGTTSRTARARGSN